MSSITLRRPLSRSVPWVCENCAAQRQTRTSQRRWQSQSAAARKSVVDVLEERGYLNQITGSRDELAKAFEGKRIGAYVGVDPTASSMHVGHLIPYMALFWLYLYGHKAITLVGGGTASVGDPTGRTKARPHLSAAVRRQNINGIEKQLSRIWTNVLALGEKHKQGSRDGKSDLLNNERWLQSSSILDVLSTVGAGLRLGAMMGRDTVKTRMTDASQQSGMSFAEFCYPVLQAWDWWFMFRNHDVSMQIGGSDQYGNILSGVDGIKYALKLEENSDVNTPAPLGFTVPLLTTPSGEKFGKSAGNAIWLDKEQTSIFDLYGFFVGMPDSEVEKLLNFFTFLPQEKIAETMRQHVGAPEKRVAQHLLAREFVELVHGVEDAEAAQRQHMDRSKASSTDDSIQMPSSQVIGADYASLLKHAGLVESRSKGVALISSGGAYRIMEDGSAMKILKAETVALEHLSQEGNDATKFLTLRAGKWKTRTISLGNGD